MKTIIFCYINNSKAQSDVIVLIQKGPGGGGDWYSGYLRKFDREKLQRNEYFLWILWPDILSEYKLVRRISSKFKEGGDITLFIKPVPKVLLNVILFFGSTTLGTFIEFWLVGSLSWVFKTLIVIYRRSNFVYHYWGCTSNNRTLSYPFSSLSNN